MERVRKHRYEGGRAIIGAAVARGELPTAHDGTLLLDAIGGMTINYFLSTPADRMPYLREQVREFATTVVDFALRAMANT